ncbi:MAG: ATP synthase F0 subunit B [Candidatus Hydrogenedentes bacterium]|nr:ATP synthase F0 subunit B [Candidatus Hydrogenedentota bacterium]
MSPAKRFLLWYFGVYLVVAVGATVVLGPPGLSGAYMEKYAHEHEHYLEIVKSDAYKLYIERPALHPPDDALAGRLGFVEQYEQRPEFLSEQNRMHVRGLFYEFFNALAVVVMAVRFARGPLLAFLDKRAAEIGARIDQADRAQREAAAQKEDAQAKMARVDEERSRIAEEGQGLASREAEAIAAGTEEQAAQIAEDTEARKRLEARRAAMQLKRDLVGKSIELLEARLKAEASEARENVLVDHFVQGVAAAESGK